MVVFNFFILSQSLRLWMETLIPYVLRCPSSQPGVPAAFPTPPSAPGPPTSSGVTLRKDKALGSLPRGSSQPSAGEERGLPAPRALIPLLFPFLLSFSVLPPVLSEECFLFPSPGVSAFFVSRSFYVCFPLGIYLCIFHGFSRNLSNFRAGLSVVCCCF